jgi:myo-inositol-1-phosphate synthase
VIIDAVRCVKLALDNGLSGALVGPSSYFKKSPPVQYPDDIARQMTEDFIAKYGHKKKAAAKAKSSRVERPARAKAPRSGLKRAARKSA